MISFIEIVHPVLDEIDEPLKNSDIKLSTCQD